MPERPPKEDEFKPVSAAPFFPAKSPKSGKFGAFNKFPTYMEDPLDDKLKAAKAAADAVKRTDAVPFKPPMKPHTTPTRSIMFHQAGPQLA